MSEHELAEIIEKMSNALIVDATLVERFARDAHRVRARRAVKVGRLEKHIESPSLQAQALCTRVWTSSCPASNLDLAVCASGEYAGG
jgi:hypothetical protein